MQRDHAEPQRATGLALAVAAPLIAVATVYAVWWVSDRLVVIGPFDRATFGWLFVVPLLAIVPLVAGAAWRGLDHRSLRAVGWVAGLALAVAVAGWTGSTLAVRDCEFGSRGSAGDYMVWSSLVGLVAAAAFVTSGLLARERLRAGHSFQGLLVGAGAWLGGAWLAVMIAIAAGFATGCNRPL